MTASRVGLRRALLCAVLVLVGFVLVPSLAQAQILYGSIVGQVTDPQKAALPGVAVTATNTGTAFKAEAVTDGTGNFVFRNLQPGTYDIKATLEGFKELHQTGLAVTAGNPRRVDLTLQLGGMQETITVTAESTLVKTEKADLSTEISSKAVTTLPLNQYRNYQSLLNLVPGASPTQFQNALIDTPGQSLRTWVNGVQPNSNTTRVDGAVSVNVWLPHHAGYISPTETIETVNVATNSFDADTGMAAGAAQTVVTKSGTNTLKGSAFEYTNNDGWNANSFYNNAFGIKKTPLQRDTYGATLGGPIVKNKLFYFGSWEHFRDRRTSTATYAVPTDKMRAGDFSEVASAYSSFKLYNPFTGSQTTGIGRTQWADNKIPSSLISPIAQKILAYFPRVNSSSDLNSNSILDDYAQERTVKVDRNNYDLKLTWQRSASHSIWGKFSMMRAKVTDNFNLGWDNGSLGDTKVYVGAFGHTWTLSPTTVLDGNFGYYRQSQIVTGPDYNDGPLGLNMGIPGVNSTSDPRANGLPTFSSTYTIGGTPSWMPLWRKEINYSFSSAVTKVFPKHELRAGVDIVKLELNHLQAEFGDYGLHGGFSFSGNTTGACLAVAANGTCSSSYNSPGWNSFAALMMGLPNYYAKDTQTEMMTGREWQTGFYLRDRWRPSEKMTINLGLRGEYFPLMSRAGHGLEVLNYQTYMVTIGGLGGAPKDAGLKLQEWYIEPRVGLSYRLSEKSVLRAGYSQTRNPLPWSRPMRGSFPYDINFNNTAETYGFVTTLAQGVPTVVVPNYQAGAVKLPAGVFMRSPNTGTEAFAGSGSGLDRARIQQWNIAFERKLPGDISAEIAYVGTATDGGYADLNVNYGIPGGGNTSRIYYASAGNTAISDWGSRTKSRYKGLQLAVNRPFKGGLMLKGAYTWSQAKNMADEDGWVGLTWNSPLKFNDNFAIAGFDRTHVFQMGWVYELPFLKHNETTLGKVLGGWQLNGVGSWFTGTPFSISGSNSPLNCPSCGSVFINVTGDVSPTGTAGSNSQTGSSSTWYDKSAFSQPSGLDANGFGTSKRNQFRRPAQWNVDMSLFKAFQIQRVRTEIRLETANFFNHVNWGAPVTTFTANNFLQFTPSNTDSTWTPGPRRVTLGLRLAF
jgi:hypothetical protein